MPPEDIEHFLTNYDVQQEQRELAPVAQALQDLATDCAHGLPLFWQHLCSLSPQEFTKPLVLDPTQRKKIGNNAEGVNELIATLNELPLDQKMKIKDSLNEDIFGNSYAPWTVKLDWVLRKNGLRIPVGSIKLRATQNQYHVEALDLMEQDPQRQRDQNTEYPYNVTFANGRLNAMDFQAKNAQGRVIPFRRWGNEMRPCVVFWGEERLRIQEVRFLNENRDLSRKTGPARITYTVGSNKKLMISSTTWYYNSRLDEGEAHYKERLKAWQERTDLIQSVQPTEEPIQSSLKKKKL